MAETNEQQARSNSAGVSPAKTAMICLAVLALEGGTIAVTMYLSGGPNQAQAVSLEAEAEAQQNKPVEVLVVKDKYPNVLTGRHFLYDTEVYIVVRNRDAEKARQLLEEAKAQITVEISTIIRRAEPAWFQEATLATLRRQMKAVLDERIVTEDGKSAVQDVLITKCIQYRSSF